jgi:hypothetical protein
MGIIENNVFGFLMLNLDTLSLKAFLFYIYSSNGSISYMVGRIIMIPSQLIYGIPSNSLGMRRYYFFC